MDLYHGKYDIIFVPIVVLHDLVSMAMGTDIERITQNFIIDVVAVVVTWARSRSNNC